jgi:MFS family permease
MNERHSGTSDSRNSASDPSARPGKLLSNPAVQRKFYDAQQPISGPPQLAFLPPGAQENHDAEDGATLLAKYARYRHRAVWAQALVLFNVVGIPLSHGVYLEQYYSSALPASSLSALSVTPALQILCILGTPLPIGWMYYCRGRRSGWRLTFLLATLLAFGAQLGLQWIKSYVAIMLLQGLVLGAALGTLFTLSTLVLSTHYRFNLPLVSMQSGAMGFLGAIVHTIVARQRSGTVRYVPAANAGLLLGTSLVAYGLMRRVEEDTPLNRFSSALKLPSSISKIRKERGTILFVLGYMLVFSSIFIFPVYIVAILTQSPSLITPQRGTWILATTFATAACSACISANPTARKRLGPVNTLQLASFPAHLPLSQHLYPALDQDWSAAPHTVLVSEPYSHYTLKSRQFFTARKSSGTRTCLREQRS